MRHYVLTRFDYSADYPSEKMKRRIELFKQFTVPSVRNQTNRNFEWFVSGNAPILIDVPEIIRSNSFRSSILEHAENEDLILTTRLDSDDILLPTFIEDVQTTLTEPGLLDFPGYILDLRANKFYEEKMYNTQRTSAFVTLAERPLDLKTVYSYDHSSMWQHFNLKRIEKRNWVYLIHDTNLSSNKIPSNQIKWIGDEVPMLDSVKVLCDKT